MPLLIPSPLRLYSPETTHHGGGAHGVHHYEDLCPKTLEAFHKMAFDHEYEVRLRYTTLHGSHYAALCGLTVMGLYPNLAYAGRGRPPKSFTPLLLVPIREK